MVKELIFLEVIHDAFKKGMEEKREELKKRKDTNAKCVAYLDKWIQDNFKTQGEKSINGRWQALSQVTLDRRRKEGKGAKILEDMGYLKSPWKHLYTHNDAKIQSGVNYGMVHELGNPDNRMFGKAKAPIPQRKILPTHEQVWPALQKIYEKFLGEKLK